MKNYPAGGPGDSRSGPRLGPAQLGVLRVGSLLVLAALATSALLTALVWGKEGFGREDLPRCGAGLLVLAGSGGAWWLLCRRVRPAAHPGLFAAGMAVLTLPAMVYAALGTETVINTGRGAWLARRATISGYRESPLVWRGFPAPVGLRVQLDLAIPAKLRGNLLPPRLALGGPKGFAAQDYFARPEGGTLGRPVFQRLDDPEPGPLASGEPVHLDYDLYPGYVQRVSEDVQLCLDTTALGRAREPAAEGRQLGAAWFFAGPGGLVVDLSPPLTATLRARSALAGHEGSWDSLVGRLTPSSLGGAGFAPCTQGDAPSPGSACWCRPPP